MTILELQAEQQSIEVQLLQTKIKLISDELIKQTPQLPTALADIHKMLLIHEELVHMLDDDDRKKLHHAFELFKNQRLIQQAVKASGKNKKISNETLANL